MSARGSHHSVGQGHGEDMLSRRFRAGGGAEARGCVGEAHTTHFCDECEDDVRR